MEDQYIVRNHVKGNLLFKKVKCNPIHYAYAYSNEKTKYLPINSDLIKIEAIYSHYLLNKDLYDLLPVVNYGYGQYIEIKSLELRDILKQMKRIKENNHYEVNEEAILRNFIFPKGKWLGSDTISVMVKFLEIQDPVLLENASNLSELISKVKLRQKEYYAVMANNLFEIKRELKKYGNVSYEKKRPIDEFQKITTNPIIQKKNDTSLAQFTDSIYDISREPISINMNFKMIEKNEEYENTLDASEEEISDKKNVSIKVSDRSQSIVSNLKQKYNDTCQVCKKRLEVGKNEFMSEVHHIKPLGKHFGSDTEDNMMVLCPNHHTMFDRGSITIDLDKKTVIHINPKNAIHRKMILLEHKINIDNVNYHNLNIFKGNTK